MERRRLRSFDGLAAFALLLALRPPVRHAGPDRARIPYDEPHAGPKRRLLAVINAERAEAGASPLKYDLVGAKAGDAFCREEAAHGYTGHWDLSGRAPYVRYAEAGGVDYHAENSASRSRFGGELRESVEELLLEAHRRMMEEKPPNDPHRRTVLDPIFTHVGFGVALDGGEFRMTEEYSRKVAEWVEVPAEPLRAGSAAPFAVKLPPGWEVGAVDLAWERPPRAMSAREIGQRLSYSYPGSVHSFRPQLPRGQTWRDGTSGDFPLRNGRLALDLPLDHGAGNYVLLVFAGPAPISGRSLEPITAAVVKAY